VHIEIKIQATPDVNPNMFITELLGTKLPSFHHILVQNVQKPSSLDDVSSAFDELYAFCLHLKENKHPTPS
jgi:uncharacterized protein with PQ loop repeat